MMKRTAMSLLRFLGLEKGGAPNKAAAETETLRRIAGELDRMEPEKARYIAAFAYILGRVARADMQVSEEETRQMERLVAERGGLSDAEAVLVVQVAKTQGRLFGGTEDFLVTREFSKFASREQKLGLLECLYAVSAADESVSSAEDQEISRIAQEIGLEHPDTLAARSAYRQYLSFLKKSSE